MEILRNKNNNVTKFIHKDGSETAIKTVLSQIKNNKAKRIEEDRNKYSIFISISQGCEFKCKFCYLTLKNSKYKKLTKDNILNNLKAAVEEEIKHKPSLSDKYVKLSWMGMGDAFNKPKLVSEVTMELLEWVIKNNYAKGLDGVDLSTIFPKNVKNWKKIYQELNSKLKKYKLNPKTFIKDNENKKYTKNNIYEYKRSIFRLFYSIGSANQIKKEQIIPNVKKTEKAIEELKEYSQDNKNNVIFHYMFIEELNATEDDINRFIELNNKHELNMYEKRILRYNFCDKSKYKETITFDNIIKILLKNMRNIKVQISAGSEVKAACGQFIVKRYKNNEIK